MKKIYLKPKLIITGIFVLASAALVAGAIGKHLGAPVKRHARHIVAASVEEPIIYDSVLLKKFISAIRSLDFNQPECTYKGIVDLEDGNDTTNNVHNLRFSFCRSGKNYYYQVGNAEIIHHDGINLYIQHDQHKIALSGEAITIKSPVTNIPLIEKTLQGEHYTLQHSQKGNMQTLSLINEHHISCKEISVTLDTVSGKLKQIYTRLTDFGSPADKNKERTMNVTLTEVKDQAEINAYPSWERFVKRSGGKWELTDAYRDYELIQF
ncbi:MAG TPA: hypothetical protein VHB54_04465 [Mucilaginibacter sp.]|nr:hypothetical protein [Mucilaginibacter sp.]